MISTDMIPYRPLTPSVGKLCYQYCSKQSHLPIRDILNDHGQGFKLEPNYETATYNWCNECNQPSVHSAVNDRLSHILFITRYAGNRRQYVGRYFIVGYYEIGWTAVIEGRTAIRAKRMCFVPVEHAYEITDERWQRINCHGTTKSLTNLRCATQRIRGELLGEILSHLGRHPATDEYLHEVARLKAEVPPFDHTPDGRIFIINVGANTSHDLQSLLFEDGRFELVPIPEWCTALSDTFLTYGDLRQFNDPRQPLLDLFRQPLRHAEARAHSDPEFDTLTYGDNIHRKTALASLKQDDFLFFLARLVPWREGRFNKRDAIFALIGYLEIAAVLDDPGNPLFTSAAYKRNAHVRRWRADPSTFNRFAVFKGSVSSRRFRYAVPFDRDLVQHVPILKANGADWDWGRTTDLGVIGANTRTVRMHIDPSTEQGNIRADRFWRRVFETQNWRTLPSVARSAC